MGEMYANELAYMMTSVQGVSTNHFKILPTNTSDALAGRKVSFAIPSNALINARSVCLSFSADANQVASQGGRLPPKAVSLIDRIEVSASGQQISQGYNYKNVLAHMKDIITGYNTSDPVTGHPTMVRTTSPVDGYGSLGSAVLSTTLNESYVTAGGQTQFTIRDIDFFNTCQPSIIDTGLIPDMIVSVYLAGNETLGSCAGVTLKETGATDFTDAGAAGAAFKLYNMQLTLESIGLASSVLDEMIASEIGAKGFVPVVFKNILSWSDTHSGSSKWSVQTQSLDRVWVSVRPKDYDTSQRINVVEGHKSSNAYVSATSGGSAAVNVGLPGWDSGGSAFYNTNSERYLPAYFNFSEYAARLSAATPSQWQMVLNGSYIPSFRASIEDMWQISQVSKPYVGHMEGVPQTMSLDQYKKNFFCFCVRLNLPGDDSRTISGLDTRSVALQGYVNSTGLATTCNLMIFAECSSVLRIGAGRQINTIL